MPIIRNPFRKSGVEPQGENRPPLQGGADRGFQQTKVVGAKPVDIKEPTEYKLSGMLPSLSRLHSNCKSRPADNVEFLR